MQHDPVSQWVIEKRVIPQSGYSGSGLRLIIKGGRIHGWVSYSVLARACSLLLRGQGYVVLLVYYSGLKAETVLLE